MKSKHNSLRSIMMLLPGLALLIFAWPANAQLIDDENLSATNIDISATHLQFHVDQGKTQSQSVFITNN